MVCRICGHQIDSNKALRNHLLKMHGQTPWEYYEKYPQGTKLCSKCKEERPISHFFKDQSNNFGYRTQCIFCMRGSSGKRQCPLCGRLFQWAGIVNHIKTEHGIPPKDAYEKHLREKFCQKCKKVKPLTEFSEMANEELAYFSWCKDCNIDRNIARLSRDSKFGLSLLLLTRLGFQDRCFVCGCTHDESMARDQSPLEVDHLVPSIKGGQLSLHNVLLLCKRCNLQKGTKTIDEFLASKITDPGIVQKKLTFLKSIQIWLQEEFQRLKPALIYKEFIKDDTPGNRHQQS